MNPLVVKVPPELLDELRVALLDADNTLQRTTTNPHEAFRFYHAGGSIIGYSSGKVVANSPETASLLKRLVAEIGTDTPQIITIGSDEAGKGEWLGPLVAAAVALNPQIESYLRSEGVQDSKDLSIPRIGELADLIEERALAHHVVLIPPKTFDERMAELKKEGKNLNHLLAWAHSVAIDAVLNSIEAKDTPIKIIVDEFDAPKMRERLSRRVDLSKISFVQRHKAESECAVASASILARDARETWIDKMSFKLGVELTGIPLEKALSRRDLHEFAKISYLKNRL